MKKINEDIKPTLKEPVSKQSKNFEKNFKKTMVANGITLTEEVDELLTEKEQSLKKKIFKLPKMEALVFSDPKLRAIYDDMSINGEEKYGYHYNETIMNMMFNDYVLNSAHYLQKYKMAIPKEKKRRDKSGINQARKAGEEIIKKMNPTFKVKEPEKKDVGVQPAQAAESVQAPEETVKVQFLVNEKDPKDPDVFAYFPEENYDREGKFKMSYSHLGQHSAAHPQYAADSREAKPYEYKDLKAELESLGYQLDVVNQTNETTGAGSSGGFAPALGYEKKVDETTGTGSVGGSGMGSGGYAGPAAWGGGDLMKGGKSKAMRRPMWPGGTIIQESNYLTDPSGFQKFVETLNENIDDAIINGTNAFNSDTVKNWNNDDKQIELNTMKTGMAEGISPDYYSTKEDLKHLLGLIKQRGQTFDEWLKYGSATLAGDALYAVAIAMANKMLPISWNELPDTNSMWDYIDENGNMGYKALTEAVKEAVNDRISEEGMSLSDLGMDESKINEKSKSPEQQRLFGMVHALQKGEMKPSDASPQVKKMAKTISKSDVEDFASTKHSEMKEEVNENPMLAAAATGFGAAVGNRVADKAGLEEEVQHGKWVGSDVDLEISLEDYNAIANQPAKRDHADEWFVLYKIGTDGYGTGWIQEADLDDIVMGREWANSEEVTRFLSYIGMNFEEWVEMPFISKLTDLISYWGVENIMGTDYSPLSKEEAYAMAGIENTANEDTQTMIQGNNTSMSNKATPTGEQPSNVDMGARATGGMHESEDKFLQELNNELEAYSIHHNKLKVMAEDRKPSALVLRDRMGSENEKNFKKDLNVSGTKEIIDVEKELQWKDQQTDVPKDPQKLGLDIEKKEIKSTDAKGKEHLKNVGDSANDEGDEIPKRNMTDDEQKEVDMMRLGQHSLVYDNEPSKRFEDRMKADMGDKVYKMRQDQMEYRSKMPTYNKDNQPTQDGEPEKYQFNKEKAGFNKQIGINESIVSGKYYDILGKRRIIDFKLNETLEIVNEGDVEKYFELNFAGMGNTYTNKVDINEGVVAAISEYKFYTDGSAVYRMKAPVQKLNESEQKDKKPVVNEQMDKMKHLLGYKPNDFVNTKGTKENRGF